MYKAALPTLPISTLRTSHEQVISKLKTTPYLLTHNGHGAGVLVHPEEWNKMVQLVDKLREDSIINQRIEEMDKDPSMALSMAEVEQGLISRGLMNATD